MKYFESMFQVVGTVALIFLLCGIYRPWIVLWWEEKQNRRRVVSLYGTIALISFFIYGALRIV